MPLIPDIYDTGPQTLEAKKEAQDSGLHIDFAVPKGPQQHARGGEPSRFEADDQPRAADGKWTATGGGGHAAAISAHSGGTRLPRAAFKAFVAAGKKVEEMEGAVGEWAKQQVERLPSWLSVPALGVFKLAMAPHEAAQAAVKAVAAERGLDEDQQQKLTRLTCVANYVLGGKVLPGALKAAGAAAGLSLAGSFVPVGSLGYLALSTATDPHATWRASLKATRSALLWLGTKEDYAKGDEVAPPLVEAFARRSSSPSFDAWTACFLAALHLTEGKVGLSLAAADHAVHEVDDEGDLDLDDEQSFAPEQYAAGSSNPMDIIRRMPTEKAKAYAIGLLALFDVRPDLRRSFNVNDLAFITAAAGL